MLDLVIASTLAVIVAVAWACILLTPFMHGGRYC